MKCPYCGAEESKVIDSRPTEDSLHDLIGRKAHMAAQAFAAAADELPYALYDL